MAVHSVVNQTQPDTSLTPLAVLRERTRDLHAHLESVVNIGAALASRPSYIRLLRGYLNIYTAFEAALALQSAPIIRGIYQSRVPSLERDLHALGADPQPILASPVPLPELNDLDAILGALYVVEGSSLGGQIIYRDIQQRLLLDAGSGAAFFFGAGDQTGSAWKHFTTLLNQHIQHPQRAADAAAAIFRAFECGLNMAQESEPTT